MKIHFYLKFNTHLKFYMMPPAHLCLESDFTVESDFLTVIILNVLHLLLSLTNDHKGFFIAFLLDKYIKRLIDYQNTC